MNLYSTLRQARPLLEHFIIAWLNVYDAKNCTENKIKKIWVK